MDKMDALNSLAALSQERRLDIFRLLVRAGDAGLNAGEIAERLGELQNSTSTNLGILARADLLTVTREGRSMRYRANYATARDLIGFLLEDCCNGRAEVCAPILEKLECLN
jgi:ArsR family transcriptional regulator